MKSISFSLWGGGSAGLFCARITLLQFAFYEMKEMGQKRI